jgi:hypothetical protein
MTVKLFAEKTGCKPICIPSPEREINGVYIGDLLSWVMGNANADDLWITIMSNINIVAVASLTDASCILLAEDVAPDRAALDAAMAKGVNILSTPLSAYEAALLASETLR